MLCFKPEACGSHRRPSAGRARDHYTFQLEQVYNFLPWSLSPSWPLNTLVPSKPTNMVLEGHYASMLLQNFNWLCLWESANVSSVV
jgi:hypothetical protein